jgi:hypothetical protein
MTTNGAPQDPAFRYAREVDAIEARLRAAAHAVDGAGMTLAAR